MKQFDFYRSMFWQLGVAFFVIHPGTNPNIDCYTSPTLGLDGV